MKISATPSAVEVVALVRAKRRGALSMTIGTGCCESTAAFLFEDHIGRNDGVVVGCVDGVDVVAPEWLASKYDGDELVLDVDSGVIDDSMSIETDLGYRFTLLLPA